MSLLDTLARLASSAGTAARVGLPIAAQGYGAWLQGQEMGNQRRRRERQEHEDREWERERRDWARDDRARGDADRQARNALDALEHATALASARERGVVPESEADITARLPEMRVRTMGVGAPEAEGPVRVPHRGAPGLETTGLMETLAQMTDPRYRRLGDTGYAVNTEATPDAKRQRLIRERMDHLRTLSEFKDYTDDELAPFVTDDVVWRSYGRQQPSQFLRSDSGYVEAPKGGGPARPVVTTTGDHVKAPKPVARPRSSGPTPTNPDVQQQRVISNLNQQISEARRDLAAAEKTAGSVKVGSTSDQRRAAAAARAEAGTIRTRIDSLTRKRDSVVSVQMGSRQGGTTPPLPSARQALSDEEKAEARANAEFREWLRGKGYSERDWR